MASLASTLRKPYDQPLHGYYPPGLELIDYAANQWNFQTLLAIFSSACVVVLGFSHLVVTKIFPGLGIGDRSTILWFILTGTIHFFFEGYFAINHQRMAPAQDLFGQLWKEYALSDSRYLSSDPFVLCMESITAICWGPLSYLTAYLIAAQHPLRFPIQAIVSLGQIYGDVLYYATSMFDLYYKNVTYSRPEAYYFWGYFVFINAIWIVIPGLLLWQSVMTSSRAFRALSKMSKSLQANGHLKKSR